MAKQIVHTCYGCPDYYRDCNGKKQYSSPYSYRHCNIDNPWECDYFANAGEPRKRVEKPSYQPKGEQNE